MKLTLGKKSGGSEEAVCVCVRVCACVCVCVCVCACVCLPGVNSVTPGVRFQAAGLTRWTHGLRGLRSVNCDTKVNSESYFIMTLIGLVQLNCRAKINKWISHLLSFPLLVIQIVLVSVDKVLKCSADFRHQRNGNTFLERHTAAVSFFKCKFHICELDKWFYSRLQCIYAKAYAL